MTYTKIWKLKKKMMNKTIKLIEIKLMEMIIQMILIKRVQKYRKKMNKKWNNYK